MIDIEYLVEPQIGNANGDCNGIHIECFHIDIGGNNCTEQCFQTVKVSVVDNYATIEWTRWKQINVSSSKLEQVTYISYLF